MKCRPFCAVFSSHFFVPIVVFVITFIGILTAYLDETVPAFSSNSKSNLDQSDDPVDIIQLTDLHFTHVWPGLS